MTSRKKVPVFLLLAMSHLRMAVIICPPTFAQIALSNSELLTFSDIQDGDRRHLGFSIYVNLAIPAC